MPDPSLVVRSPFDQSTVCELPYDQPSDVARELEDAQRAWLQWRELTLPERIGIVQQGLGLMQADADRIAADVSRQMGKPITQARAELKTMLGRAEQAIRDAPLALAPDDMSSGDFVRRIHHEPLGVVLNIAAWNYPLLIPINVLVPALLAGNVLVLKHSARTPLTGQAFARAFASLEVPHLVTDLILTHAQTEQLIADRRIAHVAFTGSVAGGRAIYRSAADRPIDVGLELGGKDPAYVAADADLARAIDGIVDGACYNAGQSCCAVERVYVHQSCYDDFLAGCRAQLANYVLDDPLLETTTMGPLASRDALDVIERQIDDAVRRSARLLHGGHRTGPAAASFFEPTLLADVPNESLAMQDETFGPLLPVLPVADDQDAVALMNDSAFGLTASIWTNDQGRAEWMAARVNAGTIFQNRCDYIDPMLPWTGWYDSGKGSTLSRYGYYHLTRRKAIHFRR
jgi:acyl-CoA reductase-like NAD-dependent aldehyde dehydrogenase